MTQAIRLLMFFEGSTFIVAALIHFGLLINGYQHHKAGTAEKRDCPRTCRRFGFELDPLGLDS